VTVRVKICGLTDPQDAAMCVEEGADAVGFVVEYPVDVPWNLTRAAAARLMEEIPPFVTRVAVVGGTEGAILEIAEATEPHVLQLHFDETEQVVEAVAERVAGTGIQIVKALRVEVHADADRQWDGLARRFLDAGADAILFDSKTKDRPAGTGRPFDWSVVPPVSLLSCPVILAGGLTPENVDVAIREVRPYAVDVIGSVEDARHRKSRERVRAFVGAVRAASAALDGQASATAR
jgi:phosphoribosylanthranilate isomerase